MSYCENCGAKLANGAKFCPKCGAGVAAPPQASPRQMPPQQPRVTPPPQQPYSPQQPYAPAPQQPRNDSRKPLMIVLFVLIGVIVTLGVVIAIILFSKNTAEAKTFDFTCSQYNTEINRIMGENKLKEDKWKITEANAVYVDNSFNIDLDLDKKSEKIKSIKVGHTDSEDAAKIAAVSLMIVEPAADQRSALIELAELKEGSQKEIVKEKTLVYIDRTEKEYIIEPKPDDREPQTALTAATEATDKTKTSQIETTLPATTVEPTTQKPVYKAEDYVRTEKECQAKYSGAFLITGENDTARCRQPQLTIDSSDAKTVNNEIKEKTEDVFEKANKGDTAWFRTDYVCYINGNILSLAVEIRTVDTPNSMFYVYNFNVETGKRLSYSDIMSAAGVNEAEAYQMVKGDMLPRFEELEGKSTNPSMASQIEKAQSRTLADENVKKSDFFLNGDGKLCACYRYYWVAGAENYGAVAVLNAT